MFFAQSHIIRAESGCDMHDSGAFIGRDKISGINLPAIVAILKFFVFGVIIEKRFVSFTDKIASTYTPDNFMFFTENRFYARLGKDIYITGNLAFYFYIFNIWIYRERHITRQCPRCSCPSQ